MKQPGRPWTTLEVRRVKELAREGKGPKEIASIIGRPTVSVQRVTRRLGFRFTPPRQDMHRYKKKIIDLHSKGLSDLEIGRKIGLSRYVAWKWRRLLGLKVNPPSPEKRKEVCRKICKTLEIPSFAYARWGPHNFRKMLAETEGRNLD